MSRDRKSPPPNKEDLVPCPLGCGHPGLKNINAVRGHLRFAKNHGLTTDEIHHVMVREGLASESAPVRKVRTARIESIPEPVMIEATPPEKEDVSTGRDSSVSVNDVIAFRGRLRQYATRLGEAEGSDKFDLIPQKEFLKYAQERLNETTIPTADFVDLRDAFEDVHRPTIDAILGPVDRSGRTSSRVNILSSQDLEIKKARLLSRTRELQKLIYMQEDRDRNRLDAEITILRNMSRQMAVEDISEFDLNLIEVQINNEIQPHIDAVVQTPPVDRGTNDFLDRAEDDLEREFRLRKLGRMNREEMVKDRELTESLLLNNMGNDNRSLDVMIQVMKLVLEMKKEKLEIEKENQKIIFSVLLKMLDE